LIKPPRGSPGFAVRCMMARFLVHCHSTGRKHLDLRLVQDDLVRSWSLLKPPPERMGERRLAVERKVSHLEEVCRPVIEEEAFGAGKARLWDGGEVAIDDGIPDRLILVFEGTKMTGNYEMRRMRWYPGNRWLIEKSGADGI